jgi:threonine aldolase
MYFASDTSAPAHPAILAALAEANSGPAPSYGADPWTARAETLLRETFETDDLDVWLVASGTAANALGLAALCPAAQAILCHADAHIERDERGAPEFFSGGKLSLLPGEHAKIDAGALKRRLDANRMDFVHETPARVLSLSNLTEWGAAYRAEEVAELTGLAHAAGLSVHLDGARFANAVAAVDASAADMSWRAGVDVMSFGATKNGALGCEAIILFGAARDRFAELKIRAKRGGHMPPKMRFLGAQMAAYLSGGLWLDLARTANASARDLARALLGGGAGLAHPVDGNEVFVNVPDVAAARLRAAGAVFHDQFDGSRRLVCSWATSAAEIEAVAETLRQA